MSILHYASWGVFDDLPYEEQLMVTATINKELQPWRYIVPPNINKNSTNLWTVALPSYDKNAWALPEFLTSTLSQACRYCLDNPPNTILPRKVTS